MVASPVLLKLSHLGCQLVAALAAVLVHIALAEVHCEVTSLLVQLV